MTHWQRLCVSKPARMCSSGIRENRRHTGEHLIAALALAIATFGSGGSPAQVSAATSWTPGVRLSGIVREAATMRILPGVHILVASGANAGASAVSEASGAFTLQNLAAGAIDLQATKDGYLVARVPAIDVSQNTTIDVRLYAAPPRNVHGAVAVARCNDESWSWAETPALACTNNGGVATAYVRARAFRR
jgi:hypothetical protein